ncbi:hypothetical protein ISF6_1942 [Piscinibacter sakaiensis]|uniref:Uncharacterized protein n=1 Tax=Piscinibacter sakaiensis TaxID=1547922 RepID=A0A0K8P0C3_PISS1|nr:hypothetical protein ISF6_1942 [Piscinibacter sakaiensis]
MSRLDDPLAPQSLRSCPRGAPPIGPAEPSGWVGPPVASLLPPRGATHRAGGAVPWAWLDGAPQSLRSCPRGAPPIGPAEPSLGRGWIGRSRCALSSWVGGAWGRCSRQQRALGLGCWSVAGGLRGLAVAGVRWGRG